MLLIFFLLHSYNKIYSLSNFHPAVFTMHVLHYLIDMKLKTRIELLIIKIQSRFLYVYYAWFQTRSEIANLLVEYNRFLSSMVKICFVRLKREGLNEERPSLILLDWCYRITSQEQYNSLFFCFVYNFTLNTNFTSTQVVIRSEREKGRLRMDWGKDKSRTLFKKTKDGDSRCKVLEIVVMRKARKQKRVPPVGSARKGTAEVKMAVAFSYFVIKWCYVDANLVEGLNTCIQGRRR